MVQVGPQSMVDWGAFVLSNANATGLAALSGTGSRGLSMARVSEGYEQQEPTLIRPPLRASSLFAARTTPSAENRTPEP